MVKRPGREAGHLPPSSAEVKNEWSCIFPPPPHTPSCRAQWWFYLYLVLRGTKRVNMYRICRCLLLTHLVQLKWVTGTGRQMAAAVLRCFSYWYKCDYCYCCFICSLKPCYGHRPGSDQLALQWALLRFISPISISPPCSVLTPTDRVNGWPT